MSPFAWCSLLWYGAHPTIVDIKRAPLTDAKLFDITATAINEHNLLRTDDGVGDMVGIGDHLGYDGDMHPFVMKNKLLRGKLSRHLHFASMLFAKHFAGRGVGWEDMLNVQAELWPNPKPKSAKCWAASQDLGNSCHTDPDNSRSLLCGYEQIQMGLGVHGGSCSQSMEWQCSWHMAHGCTGMVGNSRIAVLYLVCPRMTVCFLYLYLPMYPPNFALYLSVSRFVGMPSWHFKNKKIRKQLLATHVYNGLVIGHC
jgi:hypothetical protein